MINYGTTGTIITAAKDHNLITIGAKVAEIGDRGCCQGVGTRRLRVLDVAELATLPPGRAIVIASGMVPTLVKPQPWGEGPMAAAVEASLDRYDRGRAAQPETPA